MFSSSISDHNPKTTTLNTVKRENLKYISKFGFPVGVAQQIDSRLILYDIQINNFLAASDVELNSWVFNCLESYQLCPTLVVHMMLKVFRDEFQRWRYIKFNNLDQHIRETLRENFMAKKIYMGTPSDYVNQHLVSLVIDEKLPI